MWIFLHFILLIATACSSTESINSTITLIPPHVRLIKHIFDPNRYDRRVRPVVDYLQPTEISISMSLYQLLDLNERSQTIELNLWVIQEWHDDFLDWSPFDYGMINQTIVPFGAIWLPDTYLYNSVVMDRKHTERYINVIVSTSYWTGHTGANVKFMYPALYKATCQLDIQFFPYDQQNCTLTFSSWTSSKSALNYQPTLASANMDDYIASDEWDVVSSRMFREEKYFACCSEPWVLLHLQLVIRRKSLYYIVNLVLPTSIITVVAITGFFTPASTTSERTEKVNLGITTLLAMSILMLMVSDKMPATSDFVPLIGLFYLLIIVVISVGTFFTSIILTVHAQKSGGRPVPRWVSTLLFGRLTDWIWVHPSVSLVQLWLETADKEEQFELKQDDNESILPLLDMTDKQESMPIRSTKNRWRTIRSSTIRQQQLKMCCALEWEFLACVLDRLMLLFFLTVVIFVTVGMTGFDLLIHNH